VQGYEKAGNGKHRRVTNWSLQEVRMRTGRLFTCVSATGTDEKIYKIKGLLLKNVNSCGTDLLRGWYE